MKGLVNIIGGTYYVNVAGYCGRAILETNNDAELLTSYLERVALKQSILVYAFCLLRREAHFVIVLNQGCLASVIRNLSASYAREHNRRKNRIGPVFAPDYSAILLHESKRLSAIRYVHLLPQYLRLVEDPAQYPWSSHRVLIDSTSSASWYVPEAVLSLLSGDPITARERYIKYTRRQLSIAECKIFTQSAKRALLGPPEWTSLVAEKHSKPTQIALPSLEEFLAEHATRLGYRLNALRSRSQRREHARARALIATEAISLGIASLTEVASALNRSPSAIYLAMNVHRTSTTQV